MPESRAVTTQGEGLYIETSEGVWTEIEEITSSPSVGGTPQTIPTRHLKSSIVTSVEDIPDFSAGLTWTCQLIPSGKENSNLDVLSSLTKGKQYRVKRVMPMSNVQFIMWGTVRYAVDGASTGPIQTITITVTPSSDFMETPINDKYTVTYDANGGTGTVTDTESYGPGDEVIVKDAAGLTAPEGEVFVAWNTDKEGRGTSYDAGEAFYITENVTLYAQWIEGGTVE